MEGNDTSDVDSSQSEPSRWAKKDSSGNIPDNFLDVRPSQESHLLIGRAARGGDYVGQQVNVIPSQGRDSFITHDTKPCHQLANGLGSNSGVSHLNQSTSSSVSHTDDMLNHDYVHLRDISKDQRPKSKVDCDPQSRSDFNTAQTLIELQNADRNNQYITPNVIPVKEPMQYPDPTSVDAPVVIAEKVKREGDAEVSDDLNHRGVVFSIENNGGLGKSFAEEDENVTEPEEAQNLVKDVENKDLSDHSAEKNIEEGHGKVDGLSQESNNNSLENSKGHGIDYSEMNGNINDSACFTSATNPPEEGQVVKRKRGRPRLDPGSKKSSPAPAKRTRSMGNNNVSHEESEEKEENDSDNQTCPGCGDSFQHQAQLNEHQLTCPFLSQLGSNIKDLTYNCPLCKVVCTRKHGLKRHLLRKHPKVDSFPCIFCHMKIGPMHDFLQHVHAHLRSIASLRKQKGNNLQQSSPKRRKTSHEVTDLPESEFICIQCNMSVKNDHSLVLHMLGHKINETLEFVYAKDCNQRKEKSENQFSSNMNNHLTLDSESLQPSLPESQSTSQLPEGFSSLTTELTSTINRSFHFVAFLLQRIHSELNWTHANGPKDSEDLVKKFNALSSMSSGITEVSNCLAQLLTKGVQESDNPPNQTRNIIENSFNRKDEAKDSIDEDEDEDHDNVCDEEDDESFNICKTVRTNKSKKKKKKFKCNVCGKEIAYASSFNRHKMIHEGAKPHQCEICSKQFRRNHQLQRHYNIHCVDGNFQCNLCDYKVKTVGALLKHMVDIHDKGKEENESVSQPSANDSGNQNNDLSETAEGFEGSDHSCEENDESLVKERLSMKNRGKKQYTCTDCGAELAHYSSFMRHKMIHQNKKPYQCQVCSKSFRRKHQLQRHGMVHAKKGTKYKCEKCDFSTNTRASLEKHTFEHDSDRLYTCDICGHKTKTTHELTQHKKSHEPRICKYCEYHADNLSDLRIHERRSHLTLSCSQCDYACFSNWQLQRHQKTHNKDTKELFFCELCGFSCNTKRQFSYHMIRHTNRTPFSCPQCDYKCSSRSSLAAHKLMHAGLKPFLCSFCGLSFRRSSHLNNHLLIHKDEKQFVCRTCGHPFRTRHNLKVHEMIHTGEKHHKCHLCPFACRRNKELRLHLEKHGITKIETPDLIIVPKEELKI